jgi:hypothetical protein
MKTMREQISLLGSFDGDEYRYNQDKNVVFDFVYTIDHDHYYSE